MSKENCPKYHMIASSKECESAALQLGYKYKGVINENKDPADRPAGCFYNNNGKVYINTILDQSDTSPHFEGIGGLCTIKGTIYYLFES